MRIKPERHIVLIQPEIHWNTGNIGRTCLAVNCELHLIRPLGFSLDDKHVKRAGLDYWEHVRVWMWDDYDAFCAVLAPQEEEVCLFTKTGARSFRQMELRERMFLVFGAETRGLPAAVLEHYPPERTFFIPMLGGTRSLNLSTSAGIALYESLKDCDVSHAWSGPCSPAAQ